MRSILPVVIGASLLAASSAAQQRVPRGVVGQAAPIWDVKKWINLPAGKQTLDIDDYRGRVVYLFCFQSWCPGCHSSGFPTLQRMTKRYDGNGDIAFVAVQTVFEGFTTNTFERAKEVAQQYGLKIPVGHSGEHGRRSKLMQRYRTGGTPWVVIIDSEGKVRFNDFRATVEQASTLIDRLLGSSPTQAAKRPVPRSRGERDMLGKRLSLRGLRWVNGDNDAPPKLEGRVTLVRWWTDTCPYCARSLPAIGTLRKQFAAKGFETVAVYHPKPPHDVPDAEILRAANERKYDGPVAVDRDWNVLQREYLGRHGRAATSVSFLLDKHGVIRFVHPGPVFAQTADPREAQLNQDYEDLEAAIEALLVE